MPPVPASAKDASALGIGIEPFSIPAKAKNPEKAIDYFKYITTKEKAQQFVREKSTLMAIKGANDIELPPLLQAPAKALGDAQVVWMTAAEIFADPRTPPWLRRSVELAERRRSLLT